MADPKFPSAPGPVRSESPRGDLSASGRWPVRLPAPSRHGAISRKLFTYSNYKSWADEMRHAWDEDATADPPPADAPLER